MEIGYTTYSPDVADNGGPVRAAPMQGVNSPAAAAAPGLTLDGTAGNDTLNGGPLDDSISGFGGDDHLNGAGGVDFIFGGTGNDTIYGGTGADGLYGNDGNDVFFYGSANDVPSGGTEAIFGGAGVDQIFLSTPIVDFDGKLQVSWVEQIKFSPYYHNQTVILDDSDLALASGFNALHLIGDATAGSTSRVDVNMGTTTIISLAHWTFETWNISGSTTGEIHINGTSAAETITGSTADDIIASGAGKDTINGGAGWDTLLFDESGISFVHANLAKGKGITHFGSLKYHDSFHNIEELDGSWGNDKLIGNVGNNILAGSFGNDKLVGRGGNDILRGGSGIDKIKGGAGNDTLWGGAGDDTLTGNSGADQFRFMGGDGHDKIKGFTDNVDTLLIDSLLHGGVATAADVVALAVDTGHHVVIDFGGGDILTLKGVGGGGMAFLLDDISIL